MTNGLYIHGLSAMSSEWLVTKDFRHVHIFMYMGSWKRKRRLPGKSSVFLALFYPRAHLRDRPWMKSPPLNSNKKKLQKPSAAGAPPPCSRKVSQRICRRSGIPPPVPFIAPLARWPSSKIPPLSVTLTTQRTSRNSQAPPTLPNKGRISM